jgi:RNA polymerase sigma-B factor
LQYAESRDAELRDVLLATHTGLAYRAAQRFRGRGEEIDDLRQVALIALLQAIEPKRGIAFSSFAVPTIDVALSSESELHDALTARRNPSV